MTTALSPRSFDHTIPEFEPHPWVRGGHRQTLVGRFLPGRRVKIPSTLHVIEADQGDRLTLFDSAPERSSPAAPTAILVHGLGGCARSPYIRRVGKRFLKHGMRVVRMNLRGAGAGFGLARGTYHAGRTDDLRRVVEWVAQRYPGAPIALVGFSLSVDLVLKLPA